MSACGKLRHATAALAEIACADLRRSDSAKRRKLLGVYYCRTCEAWHVGHTKRRYLKARRKALAA